MPEAAAIIPARDAAPVLRRTLEALRGQPVHVVVVDNGSRDETARVAARHGAQVVHEPRPNRARARNTGARATSATKLLFLDADCIADPDWAERLAACLDAHPLAGGRVDIREPRTRTERFDAAWRFRHAQTIADDGYAATANLGVRRDAFQRAGGFDERFVHSGEDVDLCRRIGGIVFCHDARVTHGGASSRRAVLARGFRHGFASVQLGQRSDWRHPLPLVRGGYVIERLGIDDPGLAALARLDYAGRVAGSAWAELRRAR